MEEKIIVGPVAGGLQENVRPFNIDNSSFSQIIDAIQWRGRAKRKRGTAFLTHLNMTLPQASIGNSGASPWTINTIYTAYTPSITATSITNLVLGSLVITIQGTPNIKFIDNGDGTLSGEKIGTITAATNANPCQITSNGHTLSNGDSVTISGVTGMTELNGNTYTVTVVNANNFTIGVDSSGYGVYAGSGTWVSPSSANTGTINYLTGVVTLTHTAGAGIASVAYFSYYPNLPVMGFEDLILKTNQYPGTIAFDTRHAFNVNTTSPYNNYNVSYYKNLATSASLPGYVAKTTWTPLSWNGQDYQQFWTVNYQGAFWATNGITFPFSATNIGMQYKPIVTVTVTAGGPPATATLNIVGHGLVVGDFIFINEVVTTTGINFQTGYITAVIDANNVTVTLPNATIATNGTGGIAQYLTSNADATKDCIRWYDGDPTNGDTPVTFSLGKGWVNFCPPLSQASYSIAGLQPDIYYLCGARMIVPFKDRLLFFGPVVQTSATGSQVYLKDTVIYSQNGTPFYTASFTGTVGLATTVYHPILVPVSQIGSNTTPQTSSPTSYWEDQTGFGGFRSAGIDENINTTSSNEDVLIAGFDSSQSRFIYTGNDLQPFEFFQINSEYGSNSTFSAINFDDGVLTRGNRGLIMSNQTSTQRFDTIIPDQAFQIKLSNNGAERVCAQRDFINEWVYFTMPSSQNSYRFPTKTLFYNYRDKSWSIFYEAFTTYGQFKRRTGFTWGTVGTVFPTWADWNEPWNAGESGLLQPELAAGNQQGYILVRDEGTGEGKSLAIQGLTNNVITSVDHCLDEGDFIMIKGAVGTVSGYVNNLVFQIQNVTQNSFEIDADIPTLTYLGGGEIIRLYRPYIQTRQFPPSWGLGRKTRIGVQKYLLTKTDKSQIQLLIFLSTNAESAYNDSPLVPGINVVNSSLIYSTTLYTCPESTNLGLTPANTNLQMPGAFSQSEIWHRMNTSLKGDTVQLGFTISDEQMAMLGDVNDPFTITDISNASPCVIDVENDGEIEVGALVRIEGVSGMPEINFNYSNRVYSVLAASDTSITLDLDSSGFGAYTSGGTVQQVAYLNITAEVELHGFIINVSPADHLA